MFLTTRDTRTQFVLYSVIVTLLASTFVADVLLPLGIAVWIIYLFPAALAYFLWRPQASIITAATVVVLIIVGYFLSPPGIDAQFARLIAHSVWSFLV
jgi:hypothetical protein